MLSAAGRKQLESSMLIEKLRRSFLFLLGLGIFAGLASLALDRRRPRGLRSRAVPTGLSVAPPNGFDKEQTPRFSYSTLLQAVDLGDMSIDQRSCVAHR